MISFNDQELSAAIQNADSAAWSVRAVAGRQLAMSDKIDVVADIIHRLLLDAQDTAVTQETAVALLARKDTVGLRCVLLAASYAVETWTADEIYAALNGDPDWMTTHGADRLIKQLYELATDDDAGVRHEAQEILAGCGRASNGHGSQTAAPVGTEEGPWLNDMGDLVAEMKGAVDANAQYQANAVFADPRSVFAGQAICGDPETIHGIVLTGHAKADTKPVSMKSFHPKISGTACYAKAFEAALRRAVRTTSTQWGRTDVVLSHRGFE